MINDYRDIEPSEPWTLADAEPEDIALVAPLWAIALEHGRPLTKLDAAWIVRVLTAAPDLPAEDAWAISGVYALEESKPDSPLRTALDALLAFAPWRDAAHAERYFASALAGRIPSPPLAWDLATRAVIGQDEPDIPATVAFFQQQPRNRTIIVSEADLKRAGVPKPIKKLRFIPLKTEANDGS